MSPRINWQIETESLPTVSPIQVIPALFCILLQRVYCLVGRSLPAARGAHCGRIRPMPLSKGLLHGARAFEQRRHSEVSFVTSGLRVNPVRLVALPGHFLFDSPWSRPCRRILNRDHVIERVGTGAGPAFD